MKEPSRCRVRTTISLYRVWGSAFRNPEFGGGDDRPRRVALRIRHHTGPDAYQHPEPQTARPDRLTSSPIRIRHTAYDAMFPISDVIPSRTTPVVTIALIIAQRAGVPVRAAAAGRGAEAFMLHTRWCRRTFAGRTLLTSMFLHGGWLHFGGNMLYLWIFGDNVEDRLGHGRFLVFYLFCGVVAALGQVVDQPGLAGADGRRQRRDRRRDGRVLRALPALARADGGRSSCSSSTWSRSRRSSSSASGS